MSLIAKSLPRISTEVESVIIRFHEYVCSIDNPKIYFLRDIEVNRWLHGDLSFLPPIEEKNKTTNTKLRKNLEDIWGRSKMKIRRADLKMDGQWTNLFGEYIAEELCILQNISFCKPTAKNGLRPDLDCDNCIIEVKCETYFTSGTAGEKILGVPFKYADIPELYGKPLQILCIGGAEKESREHYGNIISSKTTPIKKEILEFYKKNGIEYVAATDIMVNIINNL